MVNCLHESYFNSIAMGAGNCGKFAMKTLLSAQDFWNLRNEQRNEYYVQEMINTQSDVEADYITFALWHVKSLPGSSELLEPLENFLTFINNFARKSIYWQRRHQSREYEEPITDAYASLRATLSFAEGIFKLRIEQYLAYMSYRKCSLMTLDRATNNVLNLLEKGYVDWVAHHSCFRMIYPIPKEALDIKPETLARVLESKYASHVLHLIISSSDDQFLSILLSSIDDKGCTYSWRSFILYTAIGHILNANDHDRSQGYDKFCLKFSGIRDRKYDFTLRYKEEVFRFLARVPLIDKPNVECSILLMWLFFYELREKCYQLGCPPTGSGYTFPTEAAVIRLRESVFYKLTDRSGMMALWECIESIHALSAWQKLITEGQVNESAAKNSCGFLLRALSYTSGDVESVFLKERIFWTR